MIQMEQIWQEHHDRLLGFIRSRIKDSADAEDILQDVFVKILTKIDTVKDDSKLQSWMFQVARNSINDYYRLKNGVQLENDVPDNSVEEYNENSMQEAANWIGLYVHALPEQYREIIKMYEIEGKSQKEIAEQLGISYVNARSRVQRGRKMLKKNLTDCCIFNVDKYGNIIDYNRRTDNCKNCND